MQRILAVGSRNPVKHDAVRLACERLFPAQVLELQAVEAYSGVPEQPWGDGETRQGALNRASGALAALPGAWLGIGQEGGVVETPAGLLACAWFAVTDGTRIGEGRSASFPLPPALERLVRSGMELGHAVDQVFGRENSKQQEGAIGLLSAGALGRRELYAQGLLMALLPFLPESPYPRLKSEIPHP